jgi:hypothetical protein
LETPIRFDDEGLFDNGFGGKIPGIANICCNAQDAGGGGIGEDPGFMNPASPNYNANPIYTFRDHVTKIAGNHTFTFGGAFIAYQKNEQNGTTPNDNGELSFSNSSAVTTGNAFADFLTGRIAQYQQLNVELKHYNRYKIFSPFIQDDWKATRRLALTWVSGWSSWVPITINCVTNRTSTQRLTIPPTRLKSTSTELLLGCLAL